MSRLSERSGEVLLPDPLRVAVLMGGQSAEREISLRTGKTVVRELALRYRVRPVQILASGRWLLAPGFIHGSDVGDPALWFGGGERTILAALAELEAEGLDVAFNGLHGPMGEDGTVQGLFRMLGIPLTGPDVIPAAVTMDKRLTKQVIVTGGLSTPPFFSAPSSVVARGGQEWGTLVEAEEQRLAFPWILKPTRLGSSVGCGIFETAEEARRAAPALVRDWPSSARGDCVLVEEVVCGRELTCGVVETDGRAMALPPIEIRPQSRPFFDFHAKYVPGASEEICPAPISAEETARVQATAVRVHELLECAPLSRTDMFLVPDGSLQVLEVNTLPGMTATSLIPLSASKAGIALGDLLGGIVEHAMRRTRPPAHSR